MRQKVREFDPPQFSADRVAGAIGQDHMARPYAPAGSGSAEVADIAPHLHCDKTWTVSTENTATAEVSMVLCVCSRSHVWLA